LVIIHHHCLGLALSVPQSVHCHWFNCQLLNWSFAFFIGSPLIVTLVRQYHGLAGLPSSILLSVWPSCPSSLGLSGFHYLSGFIGLLARLHCHCQFQFSLSFIVWLMVSLGHCPSVTGSGSRPGFRLSGLGLPVCLGLAQFITNWVIRPSIIGQLSIGWVITVCPLGLSFTGLGRLLHWSLATNNWSVISQLPSPSSIQLIQLSVSSVRWVSLVNQLVWLGLSSLHWLSMGWAGHCLSNWASSVRFNN